MFRRTSPPLRGRDSRRRGAILLVVLTMLALFAVIGLSFVLYAESEANAARIGKDAVNTDLSPPETSGAINGFLEQMIYQSDKRESALYGNELSRLMYGNAQFAPDRTSAYNGVGVYSETLNTKFNGSPASFHRTQVVRFGDYFYNSLAPSKFVRVHPDQTYADPSGYVDDDVTPLPMGATLKYVGRNAPYTYADRNNIYVAVQDPATGRIVKPSYHAPSLFRAAYAAASTTFYGLEAANPNWYTPQGYFQLLRPRTIDHLTTAEMNYLAGVSLWPIPTVITLMDAQKLYTILSGNDTTANAAVPSFQRAFPFPAANPDGSTTGDVQNVKYGEGQQTADSVWLDLKLPIINYRGTRRLQPMIAATVLPLDGRVNTNVSGNLANATAQSSNHGFGPAEVSLARILLNAAPATVPVNMLKQRYGTGTSAPSPSGSSRTLDYFHEDPAAPANGSRATYPPSYSPVDFDGNGVGPPTAPTTFATSYSYPPGTYGNSGTTNEAVQPALFFNPFQWNPLATTGRAGGNVGTQFPLADARYLESRYSAKVKTTQDFTNLGNFDKTGGPILGFSASSPQHPMNRARALLTPMSNRLSRPGVAPMAIGNISGNPANAGAPSLVLNPGATAPVLAEAATPGTSLAGTSFNLTTMGTTYPLTSTAVGGDITGSTTANAANLRAILQGVDLNRPLRDYRDPATRPMVTPATNPPTVDTSKDWPFVPGPDAIAPAPPIFPTTVTPTSFRQATDDRQALAKDIFTRLCVALNARVYYSGGVLTLPQPGGGAYTLAGTGGPWNVSQPEYDALRWVAQLSANIVDAIDPDDVSTRFVWNADPAAGFDPAAASNYVVGAGGLNDRVVFGVEKPKLLVNEVYAEVANKEGDYAKTELTGGDKFTIRFFVELLNPSNAEGTPGVDQSARSGGNARLQFAANAAFPAFSSYRIQVYDTGLALHNELNSTANTSYVLGQPTTAVPKLQATFDGTMAPTAGSAFLVEPNGGKFASVAGTSRYGFCVVGPKLDSTKTETPPTAYAPQQTDATKVDGFMLPKSPVAGPAIPDQLEYDSPVTAVDSDKIKDQVVKPLNLMDLHAVVLQRLANPYYPENASPYNAANGPYNPFITVDYMAGVEVHDGIRIGKKKAGDTDGTRTATPATPDKNFSIGRAQPYAGFQSTPAITAPVAVLTEASAAAPPLAQTLSVLQNPSTAPVAPSSPTRTTFFQHNSVSPPGTPPVASDATLILPFREPFQPDRRLINPLEILHLSMAPSHLLTRNFAAVNGTNVPNFYQQELSRVASTPPPPGVSPLVYRALESLNVKPWTYGVPHAGRTPGGVNVNMIWDQLNKTAGNAATGESTVFQAVLDPQLANTFDIATVNKIWQDLRASRSPTWDTTPVVGATVDEIDPATGVAGLDRPFKGFGVGQYTLGGGALNAQGLESTLLRSNPTNGVPLFFNATPTFTPASAVPNPYYQMEPLRKAFNNLTTVSDNYLVVFTVGFFDIVEDKTVFPTRVILRREAYEQVPGDLRSQFTAVIDRSGLAVDPSNPGGGQTGRFAQAAAANFARVADGTVGPKMYANYAISFPADKSSTAAAIKVRDVPTVTDSMFTLAVGSPLRIGDGTNVNYYAVLATPAPVYNLATGLATVTIDSGVLVDAMGKPISPGNDAMGNPIPPGRLPNHAAGELICLPDNENAPGNNTNGNTVFVPGNPGRPAAFSPTSPQFRGVVRYFGRMQP